MHTGNNYCISRLQHNYSSCTPAILRRFCISRYRYWDGSGWDGIGLGRIRKGCWLSRGPLDWPLGNTAANRTSAPSGRRGHGQAGGLRNMHGQGGGGGGGGGGGAEGGGKGRYRQRVGGVR